MNLALWIVALVAIERLVELVIARRNARRLLAKGAVEQGAGHYPLFILLHGAWLVALFLVARSGVEIDGPLVALYGLLILARIWVMASLGRFWTTRIITLGDAPLVRRGPYRFLRHPNYVVVIGEVAVLPLAFGAWRTALAFSVLNLALIGWRIRIEDRALAPRRGI